MKISTYLWRNLQRPLQHPRRPHIRTTTTKQSPQTRNRQKHLQRIHTITRHNRHPISLPHPMLPHGIRQFSNLIPQLSP
jgi:hypothetical protein